VYADSNGRIWTPKLDLGALSLLLSWFLTSCCFHSRVPLCAVACIKVGSFAPWMLSSLGISGFRGSGCHFSLLVSLVRSFLSFPCFPLCLLPTAEGGSYQFYDSHFFWFRQRGVPSSGSTSIIMSYCIPFINGLSIV